LPLDNVPNVIDAVCFFWSFFSLYFICKRCYCYVFKYVLIFSSSLSYLPLIPCSFFYVRYHIYH
jgi:hypothetical protein